MKKIGKRTIKTPPGKSSVPIERIRQAARKVVTKRNKTELEDILMTFMGRGDDKPSSEEIQRFKEAEEELERLEHYDSDGGS